MGNESVQKNVEKIVKNSFFLEEALFEKVVNFRSLARKVKPKVKGASLEAIAIALRRYCEKGSKSVKEADRELSEILSKCKVKVRTGIADFTLSPGSYALSKVADVVRKINPGKGEVLHVVFGQDAATLIVDMENYEFVRKAAKGVIVEERGGLEEVSIITSRKVESTVGWVALISRLLARNGINMIETFSCYTETILILEEQDLAKTLELLRKAREREP